MNPTYHSRKFGSINKSKKKSSFVMNTNHIVFFTQLYYPDVTTTAIIMSDLVEDLASYSMNAEVICAQPTYIKNSDPQITQITRIKNIKI